MFYDLIELSFKYIFNNDIYPHFKFLLSNERLDFCELKKKSIFFTAFYHLYQGCRYFLHMTVYKLGVYYLQIIKFLNLDSPKNENCHNLLNIMSVQACMNLFLLWNII